MTSCQTNPRSGRLHRKTGDSSEYIQTYHHTTWCLTPCMPFRHLPHGDTWCKHCQPDDLRDCHKHSFLQFHHTAGKNKPKRSHDFEKIQGVPLVCLTSNDQRQNKNKEYIQHFEPIPSSGIGGINSQQKPFAPKEIEYNCWCLLMLLSATYIGTHIEEHHSHTFSSSRNTS
jgi:hypothetical protein